MAENEGAQQKKGKGKLLIIIGLAVLLVGGGGAATMLRSKDKTDKDDPNGVDSASEIKDSASGHENKDEKSHGVSMQDSIKNANLPSLIYAFDANFVANIAGENGGKFLNLLLEVEATSAEVVTQMKKKDAAMKDAIIMLISSKSEKELSSAEGKTKLKNEITMRLENVLGSGTIQAVYFTDFSIMQQ